MSVLTALFEAHKRLASLGEMPRFGFANQDVHFFVEIDRSGRVVGAPQAFDHDSKGRIVPRNTAVPYFGGRSGQKAPPYFLWDNSAYVFGVTKKEGFDASRRFSDFRELHLSALSQSDDPGLIAVRRFLEQWSPESYEQLGYPVETMDRNIVFRLTGAKQFVHETEAAAQAWSRLYVPDTIGDGMCLVSGVQAAIARIHPPIKTFENPARLVSFDKDNDAFSSYGHLLAENAPTGISAAFAYTAVLNHFLTRGSGHRIQIGDASTVFWADASGQVAAGVEGLFSAMFGGEDAGADDAAATKQIGVWLEMIRQGQVMAAVWPDVAEGVRFHVLGLAPNAARLSVRFHWEDDFGRLVTNYQDHLANMALDPPPRDSFPPLWFYLTELAVLGKRENVPPNLPGDWMRAILTGQPYPLTLLATTLMRLRSDGDVNALRVGILKSVLIRNLKVEVPVALDPMSQNKGYVLGRLFAVYEEIQRSALGGNVNATIKDKFYGAASATPQKVFAVLDRGAANHFAKLRKASPGWAVNLEKLLTGITELMEPGRDPIPVALTSAEQAMFGIGYYHQRSEAFRKRETQTNNVEISE